MSIQQKQRLWIFNRDGWRCYLCHESVNEDNATLDHVLPKCRGGRDTNANLKTCCSKCNGGKGSRIYRKGRMYLPKR